MEGLVNKGCGHFFFSLSPFAVLFKFPQLCTWKVSTRMTVSLPVSALTPPPPAASDVSPPLITAGWHTQDPDRGGNWSGCLVFLQRKWNKIRKAQLRISEVVALLRGNNTDDLLLKPRPSNEAPQKREGGVLIVTVTVTKTWGVGGGDSTIKFADSQVQVYSCYWRNWVRQQLSALILAD